MTELERIAYELRQDPSPYGKILVHKSDILYLLGLATDNKIRMDLETVNLIIKLKTEIDKLKREKGE